MKKRSEIDDKYKIDLTEIFKNDDEFLKELETVNKEINVVSKYEGKVLKSSKSLFEVLNLTDELDQRLEKLYIYAHINNDCDLELQKYNEYLGKTLKLYNNYSSICSFIVPEITSGEQSLVNDYINENPKLKKYERLLNEIFRCKKYTLSKKEEYILNKLSDSFNSIEQTYSKLTDVDLKFEDAIDNNGEHHELNDSTWGVLAESKDRILRKDAFEKLFNGYKSVINATSELLAGFVKNCNAVADIRGYECSMESALFNNNIDKKVYDALMDSINNNLDVLHKQWKMRKDVLNIEEYHIYDTYVSLTSEYDKKYTYEEAKQLIIDSLEPLGKEYVDLIKRSFDEKWIDAFTNENKRGGAYCTCCYNTHPYVVSNFIGSFNDVSTIIHELGHAIHYYYSQTNQEYVDYSYSIFVAEVASQVNEILLALHVLKTSDDLEEKKYMLDVLMKHFKSSVVRQSMFAEFEKLIYELEQSGEVLTYQLLCDKYYELNKKYFGEDIVVDDEIRYEWARIPHFYYHFYVYQYATGYIAALKLANEIFNGDSNTLNNYLEFLKLGCTKDPVESLKIAGVDLTDSEQFNAAFKEYNEEIDNYLKLVRKDN